MYIMELESGYYLDARVKVRCVYLFVCTHTGRGRRG